MKTCETCKFWLVLTKIAGVCRRYPHPSRRNGQIVTEKDQWCGEYKAKSALIPARKR